MIALKNLIAIKSPIPSKARAAFLNALSEDAETLIVLSSFELQNPYTLSCSVIRNQHPKNATLYEALANVCYWLSVDNRAAAQKELKTYSTEIQQIILGLFKLDFQKALSRDFILDNIPQIVELGDIFTKYIKMPKYLEEGVENSLKSVSRTFDYSKAKFPAVLINVPKMSRKRTRLYYIVKRGNTIHSNLSNNMVREYFLNNFKYGGFGCIFLYSKKENHRYGKHLTPICFSENFKAILKLYRGKEVDLKEFSFNKNDFLPTIKSNYIEIKGVSAKVLKDSEDFDKALKGSSENSLVVFSNGILKITYTTLQRAIKVADYILDDEFLPIGLKMVDGSEYFTRIPDSFVEEGIENRYVVLSEKVLGDKVVASQLFDIYGAGLFQCKHCHSIGKSNFKGLCSSCFRKFKDIAHYCTDSGYVLSERPQEDFVVTIDKCLVYGEGDSVTFKVDYELVKGKQLSLPILDIITSTFEDVNT